MQSLKLRIYYNYYTLFLPTGKVRSADKLQLITPTFLPLVGLNRSKQDPINRGHGAQYLYRPPPAGAEDFGVVDLAQRVMGIFRQECGARMHWGKAGWPRWAACFDGAKEFPDTWCSFGCAVRVRGPLTIIIITHFSCQKQGAPADKLH